MFEVVPDEHEPRLEEHQLRRVRARPGPMTIRELLDLADRVVRQRADQPAEEARQRDGGGARLRVRVDRLRDPHSRVAVHDGAERTQRTRGRDFLDRRRTAAYTRALDAQARATCSQDRAGLGPEQREARPLLAALDRFQEEAPRPAPQLPERGHRRLEVGQHIPRDRNEHLVRASRSLTRELREARETARHRHTSQRPALAQVAHPKPALTIREWPTSRERGARGRRARVRGSRSRGRMRGAKKRLTPFARLVHNLPRSPGDGRIAQWKSTCLTSRGSQVRSLFRLPGQSSRRPSDGPREPVTTWGGS